MGGGITADRECVSEKALRFVLVALEHRESCVAVSKLPVVRMLVANSFASGKVLRLDRLIESLLGLWCEQTRFGSARRRSGNRSGGASSCATAPADALL